MPHVNLDAYAEILDSVRVNFFHLQPVVCIGLAAWLEQAGIGYFSAKESATDLLNSGEDEILLLDLESIQGFNACSFLRWKQRFAPNTAVVATVEQLDRFGGLLPENNGSLISPCGVLEDFVHAILGVTNRSSYVAPSLSATWDRVLAAPRFELTYRQTEILRLVANGKTSAQIAGLLGLRPKTVENHRAAIKERMGVFSAAEMVNVAHKRGLF